VAFRAPKQGVYATGRGTYNTSKRTFSGKGPAPAGSRKVRERSYSEVPTVTKSTGPTGTRYAATAFSSRQAASRATARARRASRRVARITSVRQRRHAVPRGTKPRYYVGKPTAGTPTLAELGRARSKETLGINKAGYVTTPKVRQVSGRLHHLESKARQSGGPLPGLGRAESRVARKVLRQGRGEPYKLKLAAAETGLVESGFKNLPGGDADSEGWRQERASLYPNPRNVRAGAQRFFAEAKAQSGTTAGELAANVQRPAEQYRGRYDERKPEAAAIVKAVEHGTLKPAQRAKLRETQIKARKLGLRPGDASSLAPVGKPSRKLVKRVVVAETAMREVEGTPYVWGGGHGAFTASGGLDCSGAVSYVLHKVAPGRVKAPLTSGAMGSVLAPGPGALTVFYNAGHTFLRLINRKGEAEYWGTSVGDSGAGGLTRHPTPSAAYLSQYSVGHVPGMGRKQALQLGAAPGAIGSFPGMALSASGTTATIKAGAGTTREQPGFSKGPITLAQRFTRAKRKLKALGAPLDGKPKEAEVHPILKELMEKYGSAGPAPTKSKLEAARVAARA